MNLMNLMARIGIDSTEFEQGTERSEKKFQGFGGSIMSVGGKIAGIIAGLGIAKLGKEMVQLGVTTNASMEQSGVAWTTLLGTQEKSKQMLDDITKYAKDTPFSKMGVDAMAKQLNNAGYKGEELFQQMTKFGDMGSAFGIQEDSLKEMVRQYAQVQQAGVAYTEDLNILQDRGIPIYTALAEATGTSTAEVKKMASEGKISADIYNKAIDGISGKVTGAMENQSKTFSGLWSTIKDGAENIIAKITIPIFEKLKQGMEYIGPIVDQISEAMENMSQKMAEGQSFGEAFKDTFSNLIGPELATNIGMFVDGVTFAIKGLVAFIQGDTEEARSYFSNMFPDEAFFQPFVDVIMGVLEVIKDLFNFILDNKDLIIGALTGIGTGFLVFNVATKIIDVVKAIKAFKVMTELAAVAQGALNLVMSLNPIVLVISIIAGLIAMLVYLWKTNEGFREFIYGLWNGIKDFFSGLGDFFVELWDSIVEVFTTAWQGISDFFTESIPAFIEMVVNFIAELPNKIMYWLGYALGKFIIWGAELIAWCVVAIPEFISNVITFISELPSKIWNWLVNAFNNFLDWGINLIDWATTAIPQFISAIIDFIAELPDKMLSWLLKALGDVAKWGRDLADKGKQAGKDLFNSIVDEVSKIPGKMYDIGANIVKGIWEGIQSMGDWLKNLAGGFFDSFVDGIKAGLGIHSPSKRMADEVGVFMPQGIGVGFKKEIPRTLRSINDDIADLVQGVDIPFNPNKPNQPNGGGTVINQTINSQAVLSPQQIAQETKSTFTRAQWRLA